MGALSSGWNILLSKVLVKQKDYSENNNIQTKHQLLSHCGQLSQTFKFNNSNIIIHWTLNTTFLQTAIKFKLFNSVVE